MNDKTEMKKEIEAINDRYAPMEAQVEALMDLVARIKLELERDK